MSIFEATNDGRNSIKGEEKKLMMNQFYFYQELQTFFYITEKKEKDPIPADTSFPMDIL
jgi:hypothetical protein